MLIIEHIQDGSDPRKKVRILWKHHSEPLDPDAPYGDRKCCEGAAPATPVETLNNQNKYFFISKLI